MIWQPGLFLGKLVDAGPDSFLVHQEGSASLYRTVQRIKALGKS